MSEALSKTKEKPAFRWTEQKRQAAEMVVDGRTDQEIATKLGCHRNSVYNWRHTAEFSAECQKKLEEYAARTRLKRIRETGLLTDAIAGKLAKALKEDSLNGVAVLGREYHAFRADERADFGDNVRRIEGKLTVTGSHSVEVRGTSRSFKDFLNDSAEVIDVTPVVEASHEGPQKALVALTESALQNSDLLDQIHAEDQEAQREHQ